MTTSKTMTKVSHAGSALVLLALCIAHGANAQNVPPFIQKTYPEQAMRAANEARRAVESKGALDAKTKQLIGLAVAAQIPCEYCVYFHTKAAKADGATDAQIKEAIATAAETRKWSTVLNGSAYDFQKFQREVDSSFAHD
jgi:AhpD family alkylhydroperoxidase